MPDTIVMSKFQNLLLLDNLNLSYRRLGLHSAKFLKFWEIQIIGSFNSNVEKRRSRSSSGNPNPTNFLLKLKFSAEKQRGSVFWMNHRSSIPRVGFDSGALSQEKEVEEEAKKKEEDHLQYLRKEAQKRIRLEQMDNWIELQFDNWIEYQFD